MATVRRFASYQRPFPTAWSSSLSSRGLRNCGLRLQPKFSSVGFNVLRATVMPDLKYAPSHEWVRVEGDVATIGITHFGQAIQELSAPVSGQVLEINDELETEPELVNFDPFSDGWILKVKLSKKDELSELLDSGAYEKGCGSALSSLNRLILNRDELHISMLVQSAQRSISISTTVPIHRATKLT